MTKSLPPALVDRLLSRLGIAAPAGAGLDQLAAVYGAWCRAVPFDNSRKLLHLARGDGGALPGDEPGEFFEAWLRWGAGGTCWAANGALCTLLQALGFDAVRGVATMMVAPKLPPNHGTVVVRNGGRHWLVDASMLFGTPLLLDEAAATQAGSGAHAVRCEHREGRFQVRWLPLHLPDGMDCRIDKLEAGADEFRDRHERTRGWSPFNFQVHVRRNSGDRVVGVAFGHRVVIDAERRVTREALDRAERDRVLVEAAGLEPSYVASLPDDRPTPPPPPGLFDSDTP